MAHVFQTFQEKINPATHKREFVLDKKGKKIPHPRWRSGYVDWRGKRRVITGYTSRKETEQMVLQIQTQNDLVRRGVLPPPKAVDSYATRSFPEVAEEYLSWGESQGGRGGRPWAEKHYKVREAQLSWWEDRLGLKTLFDLIGVLPKVERLLRELQDEGRAGKTLSSYVDTLNSFCNWCIDRGYLDINPLVHLGKFDKTPRIQRRAMTQEEKSRLFKVIPENRRLYISFSLSTGLRAKEIRDLRVSDLNHDLHAINLRPEITKNRKTGIQRLNRELFAQLVESAKGKQPADALFFVPSHTAREMDKYFILARIEKHNAKGKVDFHACRTAFVTNVYEAGANDKEAVVMARHSTPVLTSNIYARASDQRLDEIAEKVGILNIFPKENITEAQPENGNQKNPKISNTKMAEEVGFEPTSPISQGIPFQAGRLRPLGHSSR